MRMKNVQHITSLSLFIFYIIASSGVVSGNNQAGETPLVIHIQNDRMTARVKGIPLGKVLREIGNQIPAKIVSFAPDEELIIDNFSCLTLEKGLKRLLRNFNVTLVYGKEEKSKNRGSIIRKVIILSKSEERRNKVAEPETVPLPGDSSLETLRAALKDEDPFIREDAINSLGASKDESSIELLSRALLTDADRDVRRSAVDALEIIGSERANGPLKEALKDADAEVRRSAVDALGSIGGEAAIDSLKEALKDVDSEVRRSAVDALGFIGEERAIQALEGSLSDEDEEVSEAAAGILEDT